MKKTITLILFSLKNPKTFNQKQPIMAITNKTNLSYNRYFIPHNCNFGHFGAIFSHKKEVKALSDQAKYPIFLIWQLFPLIANLPQER